MKNGIAAAIRLLAGSQVRWVGCPLEDQKPPRVFFANHSSHLDAAIVWATLPTPLRHRTRPVAAGDYWKSTRLRRWLAQKIFHSILIERQIVTREQNPMVPMVAALDAGDSLILFPEGTRSHEPVPRPFKPGLYHLAKERPAVELVPVFLENLNRILPKGEFLPVPLLSSITIGQPMHLQAEESKEAFLRRSWQSLCALHPP